MSRTLVISLGGNVTRAQQAVQAYGLDANDMDVVRLSDLARKGSNLLGRRRYTQLFIVGAPPRAEIGYGIASLAAMFAAPREVTLVDLEGGSCTYGLAAYSARSAGFAVTQLAASAIAIAAQSIAARRIRSIESRGLRGSVLERVLYLRPKIGGLAEVGGSVTHSNEFIRALAQEGVDVEPLTTDTAIAVTAAQDPDFPCRWHVVPSARVLRAVPASAAAAADASLIWAGKKVVADVIYQRHDRFSVCGAALSRLLRRPLFLEYNGSEEFRGRYWDPTPLRRQLASCEQAALNAAERIFVVSEVDRDALLGRGIDARRVIVNPNGVAAERFATGGGQRIRAKLGILAEDVVVGFLGTFGPWHGAPVLARAFCQVAMSMPHLRLLLVGSGPELELTRRELRAGGVADRATFVGEVPPTEVPHFLDACEFLVSPHIPLPDEIPFFGSPTKLFEYMASGKAIVASRLGQIGDVLEDNATALLVEPGDEMELAVAMQRLAGDPELRQRLGQRARQQAIAHHSWRENARRVIEAYPSLSSEPSG